MKALSGDWLELDSVSSTQDVAVERVRMSDPVAVVFAHSQTAGRGRFGREWFSEPDSSLTLSMVFHDYANHSHPYLVGMAVALAAAGAIHAQLQWPNDLILGGRKVGGILTDIAPDALRRPTPVVGLGINLNQKEFPPEIAGIATSVALYHGGTYEPQAVAKAILSRLETLPEPDDWPALAPIWQLFDTTPGKKYKLVDGRMATAIGIGPEAQLICSVDGETTAVLAAEAIFGTSN